MGVPRAVRPRDGPEVCYFRAVPLGAASRGPVDKLSAARVIVIAAICAGKPFTWNKGMGGVLIDAGARPTLHRLRQLQQLCRRIPISPGPRDPQCLRER